MIIEIPLYLRGISLASCIAAPPMGSRMVQVKLGRAKTAAELTKDCAAYVANPDMAYQFGA